MLWPDANALGREMSMGSDKYIVVGITADAAHGSVMLPHSAAMWTATTVDLAARYYQLPLALRTNLPETQIEPIRRAVGDIFPDAARLDIATGRQIIARDLGRERLGAWFFSGFGLVSLTLGVAGVFGLVAYVVESRRREFGVRIALGATPAHLIRRAVFTGLMPVVLGATAGLAVAALLARAAAAFLAGMSLFNPPIFAAAAVLMTGCAAAAGYVAAWHVQQISPADALRSE
jgi:predicted lysophospholipase L1 biosynthesis ABC-type transport system permease subunit